MAIRRFSAISSVVHFLVCVDENSVWGETTTNDKQQINMNENDKMIVVGAYFAAPLRYYC